jgi:hypothetical protein
MALWLSSLMVVVLVMGRCRPPHKLAEVEPLLGGVSCRVVLGFTSGLCHTSLLFGLVADGPASDSEEVARTGLACTAVVCPVSVGKAG